MDGSVRIPGPQGHTQFMTAPPHPAMNQLQVQNYPRSAYAGVISGAVSDPNENMQIRRMPTDGQLPNHMSGNYFVKTGNIRYGSPQQQQMLQGGMRFPANMQGGVANVNLMEHTSPPNHFQVNSFPRHHQQNSPNQISFDGGPMVALCNQQSGHLDRQVQCYQAQNQAIYHSPGSAGAGAMTNNAMWYVDMNSASRQNSMQMQHNHIQASPHAGSHIPTSRFGGGKGKIMSTHVMSQKTPQSCGISPMQSGAHPMQHFPHATEHSDHSRTAIERGMTTSQTLPGQNDWVSHQQGLPSHHSDTQTIVTATNNAIHPSSSQNVLFSSINPHSKRTNTSQAAQFVPLTKNSTSSSDSHVLKSSASTLSVITQTTTASTLAANTQPSHSMPVGVQALLTLSTTASNSVTSTSQQFASAVSSSVAQSVASDSLHQNTKATTVTASRDNVHAAKPVVVKEEIAQIIVPFGWKRILQGNAIVYISPSGCVLHSLDAVQQYLLSDGTCKCGLQCPLVLHKVFNFSPQISSKPWSPEDIKQEDDLTKLCNHKRKTMAMATLQNTAIQGALPDQSNYPPQPSKKAKRKLKNKTKSTVQSEMDFFPNTVVKQEVQSSCQESLPQFPMDGISQNLTNNDSKHYGSTKTSLGTTPVPHLPTESQAITTATSLPAVNPSGFSSDGVLLSPGGTPMMRPPLQQPSTHPMSQILQNMMEGRPPQQVDPSHGCQSPKTNSLAFGIDSQPPAKKVKKKKVRKDKKVKTLLQQNPPCPNVDVRQIIMEQRQEFERQKQEALAAQNMSKTPNMVDSAVAFPGQVASSQHPSEGLAHKTGHPNEARHRHMGSQAGNCPRTGSTDLQGVAPSTDRGSLPHAVPNSMISRLPHTPAGCHYRHGSSSSSEQHGMETQSPMHSPFPHQSPSGSSCSSKQFSPHHQFQQPQALMGNSQMHSMMGNMPQTQDMVDSQPMANNMESMPHQMMGNSQQRMVGNPQQRGPMNSPHLQGNLCSPQQHGMMGGPSHRPLMGGPQQHAMMANSQPGLMGSSPPNMMPRHMQPRPHMETPGSPPFANFVPNRMPKANYRSTTPSAEHMQNYPRSQDGIANSQAFPRAMGNPTNTRPNFPRQSGHNFPASHMLTAAARAQLNTSQAEPQPNALQRMYRPRVSTSSVASENPTVANLLRQPAARPDIKSPIQMVQSMISGLDSSQNPTESACAMYNAVQDGTQRQKSVSSDSSTSSTGSCSVGPCSSASPQIPTSQPLTGICKTETESCDTSRSHLPTSVSSVSISTPSRMTHSKQHASIANSVHAAVSSSMPQLSCPPSTQSCTLVGSTSVVASSFASSQQSTPMCLPGTVDSSACAVAASLQITNPTLTAPLQIPAPVVQSQSQPVVQLLSPVLAQSAVSSLVMTSPCVNPEQQQIVTPDLQQPVQQQILTPCATDIQHQSVFTNLQISPQLQPPNASMVVLSPNQPATLLTQQTVPQHTQLPTQVVQTPLQLVSQQQCPEPVNEASLEKPVMAGEDLMKTSVAAAVLQANSGQVVMLPGNMPAQLVNLQAQPYHSSIGFNSSQSQVNFGHGQIELSQSFAAQNPGQSQMNFVPIQGHLNMTSTQLALGGAGMILQAAGLDGNVLQYNPELLKHPLISNNEAISAPGLIIQNENIIQPLMNGILVPQQDSLDTSVLASEGASEKGGDDFEDEEDMEASLAQSVNSAIMNLEAEENAASPATPFNGSSNSRSPSFSACHSHTSSSGAQTPLHSIPTPSKSSPLTNTSPSSTPASTSLPTSNKGETKTLSTSEDSYLPNPTNLTDAVTAVVKNQNIFGDFLDLNPEGATPKKTKTRGFSRKFRFGKVKRKVRESPVEVQSLDGVPHVLTENQVSQPNLYPAYAINGPTHPHINTFTQGDFQMQEPDEDEELLNASKDLTDSETSVETGKDECVNGNQSSDSTGTVEGDETRRGHSPLPMSCLNPTEHAPNLDSAPTFTPPRTRKSAMSSALCQTLKRRAQDGDSFKRELDSEPRVFNMGDLVWGQIRGCPSWPGKLVPQQANQKPDQGKFWVKWFGLHSCTQEDPDTLKTLSEGLEAHYTHYKKQRKGRKLNLNLEAAIQEAMRELDRQTAAKSTDENPTPTLDTNTIEEEITEDMDGETEEVEEELMTTRGYRTNKKRKPRTRLTSN